MENKKKGRLKIKSLEEICVSPVPTTILADVRKRLEDARQGSVIDEVAAREQEDWSYLANKIVGHEGDMDNN